MGVYHDNLRHLAQPAAPNERRDANSATLADYEALWLAEQLREYSHYGEADDGEIAIAYASYIDTQVREQGQSYVTLYAHTFEAADTLVSGLTYAFDARDDAFPTTLYEAALNATRELLDGSSDTGEPHVVDVGGETTVEFEDGAALDAIAEREMARAEAQRERERQQAFERHLDER